MEQENLQTDISIETTQEQDVNNTLPFDKDVQSRLKLWCSKLIDLSNKNSLINFNSNGRYSLKIVNRNSIDIYKTLISDEKHFLYFFSKEDYCYNPNENTSKMSVLRLKDNTDISLPTELDNKKLSYKLRTINRETDRQFEEYGYNSLYITLGSLIWKEVDFSDKEIESPIILVPVRLYKGGTRYTLSYTDEPCIINPAITRRLKNDFDIDIPITNMDVIEKDTNIEEFFNIFKNSISDKHEWKIVNSIYLAIHNFENFVICKDLEANEEEICRNSLVKVICGKNSLNEGTADEIAPMDKYDESVKPLDTYQIYPADSSQQQAIEVAKKNHNLIIEGPPGTGKSQTITNIIAELLAQGKKVLFVSQKQAALQVVYDKLKSAGLSDYCLSLHKNANKNEIMTDLLNCLEKQSVKKYTDLQYFEKLQTLKNQLNNYVKESNTPLGKLNKTPFEAIEFVSKNDDIFDIGYVFKNIADWDVVKLNSIKKVLVTYAESLKYLNCSPINHSWYGCNLREILYSTKKTFNVEVDNHKSIFENLKIACKELSTEVVVNEPKTIKEIEKMCEYADVLSKYNLHILEENIDEMINKFSLYSQKLTARLSIFQYMKDLNLLSKFTFSKEKPDLNKAVKDLETLREIKQRNFSNFDINPNNILQLKNRIIKLQEDFIISFENITNLVNLDINDSFKQQFKDIDLWKIVNKFECMQNDIDDLANWFNYLNALDKVKEKGVYDFCQLCNDKNIISDDIVRALETQFYRFWLYEVVFPQRPELSNFSREKHDAAIEEFRKLDLSQIEIAKIRLNFLLSSKTDININVETKTSEIGILKQEAKKTKRQCSLRKLFKNIPNILLKLKPCMMMSPVNVSKLLSNTDIKFDTVIFDEASQLPTEECIAAIIRANNIVVAGDSKQLPPTSCFKKIYADDDSENEEIKNDEIKQEDMESLLDQCTIANFPQCPLKWHYRSRHEHLIAFSNIHMYGNKLYTFPSNEENDGEEYGIKFVPVVSSQSDINDKRIDEARQIAKAVIEHAKHHSDRTLGVVAFNTDQANRIDDMLKDELDKHPEVKSFFDKDNNEPFFIKSIENVQGDERDVIFISVGAFKLPNGNLDMRTFNIINQQGGERRINVLITRAKCLINIFSGITDGDFRNTENSKKGIYLLKNYIDFAIRKEEAIKSATIEYANAETESPFEDSVKRVLEAHGYDVIPQVGCANYRIDLAIVDKEHPGKYILAVECDGASYHSSVTARDRDWLRQKCLENLGWKIYRIWSTDWFKNRNREIEKLIKAVKDAQRTKDSKKKD